MLKICNGCSTAYAWDLNQCPHCARPDFTPNSELQLVAEPAPELVPDPPASTPPPSSQESSDPDDVPPPPPVSALKAEHVEYVAAVLDVPVEEAASLTKPELVELGRTAAEGGSDSPSQDQAPDGTGSSASSGTDKKSSTSTPAVLQPPVPTTASPSSTPPPATPDPQESSSASSTAGSTPETGTAPSNSEEG